jgi:hypothetical protein
MDVIEWWRSNYLWKGISLSLRAIEDISRNWPHPIPSAVIRFTNFTENCQFTSTFSLMYVLMSDKLHLIAMRRQILPPGNIESKKSNSKIVPSISQRAFFMIRSIALRGKSQMCR